MISSSIMMASSFLQKIPDVLLPRDVTGPRFPHARQNCQVPRSTVLPFTLRLSIDRTRVYL